MSRFRAGNLPAVPRMLPIGVVAASLVVASGCASSGQQAASPETASCREWWHDHGPRSAKQFIVSHRFTRGLYGPSVGVSQEPTGSAIRTRGCSYSFYTADLRSIYTVEGVYANGSMTFRATGAHATEAPDRFELKAAPPFKLGARARIPRNV
jgi:hypothetical protein